MRWREAYWDAVCVFLSDALSFGLALLKWMLVLELGTHVCSMSALLIWKRSVFAQSLDGCEVLVELPFDRW